MTTNASSMVWKPLCCPLAFPKIENFHPIAMPKTRTTMAATEMIAANAGSDRPLILPVPVIEVWLEGGGTNDETHDRLGMSKTSKVVVVLGDGYSVFPKK